MKISKLYQKLNALMPPETACEWDNDGLMCAGSLEHEVKKVLLTLDITEHSIETAREKGCDIIISHHPLVFRGQKSLVPTDLTQRKLIKLIEYGIAAMSFHTRFDRLDGGVNDVLAKLLMLTDIEKFGDSEAPDCGRIGILEREIDSIQFAENVKKLLGAPFVNVTRQGVSKRVAVLGGSGDDFVAAAQAAGADTFITGTVGYHTMVDHAEMPLILIEAGHFFTENTAMPVMKAILLALDDRLDVDISNYHPIITV